MLYLFCSNVLLAKETVWSVVQSAQLLYSISVVVLRICQSIEGKIHSRLARFFKYIFWKKKYFDNVRLHRSIGREETFTYPLALKGYRV